LNSATEVEPIRRLCKRALSQDVRRSDVTSVRGPVRLTQDQNEEVASLYEAGWRPADIARVIGTTEWTVHHRLNRNGIERRPIGMTNAECREAVRLYEANESMRQISLKLGYNDKTIKKALIQAGVKIRESPRHRRA
jgi:DNA-directed RNA polymerase specialized sigma24 family protein